MASSYYEVLGVSPTADQSTIRKAYLKLSLKHHPDKNPGAEEEAKANFISIGEAYEVLGDPVRRAQYDRELQGGTFVQMLGSSVASRAASSLVQSVHTDSQQRVLERREREAAIARGESVPEPTTTETRERLFKDAKNTAQKVAEAAFGGASSSSTSSNATTCANNGRGSGMSWGQAAKLAAMAAGAMAEMQSTQRR